MSVQNNASAGITILQCIGNTKQFSVYVNLELNIRIKESSSDWSEAIFTRSAIDYETQSYSYPIHVPSGNIYDNSDNPLMRIKGAGIPIVGAFIMIQRVIYHLAMGIFYTFKVLCEQSAKKEDTIQLRNCSFVASGYAFTSWLKVSFYGIGMIFAPIICRHYCYTSASAFYDYVTEHSLDNNPFRFPYCIRPTIVWDKQTRDDTLEVINRFGKQVSKKRDDLEKIDHMTPFPPLQPIADNKG